jgi:hypothetical protein
MFTVCIAEPPATQISVITPYWLAKVSLLGARALAGLDLSPNNKPEVEQALVASLEIQVRSEIVTCVFDDTPVDLRECRGHFADSGTRDLFALRSPHGE